MTSLTTGPCTVERTVIVTGSPPATLMTSLRVANGRIWPLYSYWVGSAGSTFSMKRSCTSGLTLVKPHAMWALWPRTTPGAPGNETPATSYGQALDTTVQWRPTMYHSEGIE